jgi:hypothetical protein
MNDVPRPVMQFETLNLELDDSDQNELGAVLMAILNNRKDEIGSLCGGFLDDDFKGRLTLTEE